VIPESPIQRLQTYSNALTITVFLGLLWLPALDWVFKFDHAPPPTENRLPAKWPPFKGICESRVFITGVEDYFNDHFGFRKRLIRLNHHWKGQLFHDPSSPEVLIGKNDWLFYTGANMVENCSRQATWTDQELQAWCRLLETRRDWLRARGMSYIFVVPPDKHTVYPEYLPEWVQVGDKPTKIQQLIQHMKAHSTVELLDLRPILIDAKKVRAAYLKTDTHWNLFGAFMGYQSLVTALARQMPVLRPLALDDYKWEPTTRPVCDLVRLMGATGSYPETQCLKAVNRKALATLTPVEDPVRFPLHGPPETRTCVTLNEKGSGKAIVFHDSFARSWHQFLGRHFKEVVYVWQYNWNLPLIEQEKPDLVIDETLERFFNQQDPNELARRDQEPAARIASFSP